MSRNIILFLSLVCCSLAATDTSCKKSGAYCLNHWDCCSNTCLSFLYKCSFIPSTDIEPVPSSQDEQSAPAFLAPPATSPDTDTVSYESLLENIFNPLKYEPTAVGREMDSINSRHGNEMNGQEVQIKNDINSTADEPKCSEIGSECYTSNECCSNRCHRYLFRCVAQKVLY